jgi:hypothetical protein
MNYYQRNKDGTEILSGPFSINSIEMRRITNCGNPELLTNLTKWYLVTEDRPPLNTNEKYTTPILIDGVAKLNVIPKTEVELLAELEASITRSVTALQGMRALQHDGLAQKFLTLKSTMDPLQDFEALAFLDKAQTWEWDNEVLNNAINNLGLSEQKAELFILASTL